MNKHDRYNASSRTIGVRLHDERDAEIIAWIEAERGDQPASAFVRDALAAAARATASRPSAASRK